MGERGLLADNGIQQQAAGTLEGRWYYHTLTSEISIIFIASGESWSQTWKYIYCVYHIN